jgi:hypothetical protein
MAYDWVAEVAEGGWHWVDPAFGQAEVLTSVPVGEGCQWCSITLSALPALC